MPWGVGCSIVYNYVDLVLRNDTDRPFQLRAWVGERYLHGQLRADERPDHSVPGRGPARAVPAARGTRASGATRSGAGSSTAAPGDQVGEELVKTNCALVVYEPGPDVDVIDVS